MTITILNNIIKSMAGNRPFFYSEFDFQHYLALELKANGYDVFLEYPVKVGNVCHIDIIAKKDGVFYPIELKYKTKAMICPGLFGTSHQLQSHRAYEKNRYLFWKDVDRLEKLKKQYEGKIGEGYAVFLTNDDSYYLPLSAIPSSIDRMFRIHPGMNVHNIDWNGTADAPDYVTSHSSYKHFRLLKSYVVPNWQQYSIVNDSKTGKRNDFKFLALTI